MIHELRIYTVAPGRMQELLNRFQNNTLKIWERHGIQQIGFWTTLVGSSNQHLTYLLAWESMAERENKWRSFAMDREWIDTLAHSEMNGVLVTNVQNSFLQPTVFSAC